MKIQNKNKMTIAGLFSILLLSLVFSSAHAQTAETSFKSDAKKTLQTLLPLAAPNSGTIYCSIYLVDPAHPCSGFGYSGGLLPNTWLTTPSLTWVPGTCGSACVDVGWHTEGYDRLVIVGGKTYNWDHGEMYACTSTQCSSPKWTWGGLSGTTTTIHYVPVNTPVTIHAFYFYKAADGTMDVLTIDQVLTRGYL